MPPVQRTSQKGSFMNASLTKTAFFSTLLLAAPIFARSPQQDPATARPPQEIPAAKHCVVRAESLKSGTPGSRTSSVDCYPSFSEAIYAAMTRRYGARKLADLQDMLAALESSLSDEGSSEIG